MKYPILDVNLEKIKVNAKIIKDYLSKQGVKTCGIIKFSDGAIPIVKAYVDGGITEIGSSRIVHLKDIKEHFPDVTTMLIRIPMLCELDEVARYSDITLVSEKETLTALNEEAKRLNKTLKVVLMYDAGDLREGCQDLDELVSLALLVENDLSCLELFGIGTGFACANGVLPNSTNLGLFVKAAETIEEKIGRTLEYLSGGSTINIKMIEEGTPMPERVNHLRIGGIIANPITMRTVRGVDIPGLYEDAFTLQAQIVEIKTKQRSITQEVGKNWAGNSVTNEELGLRRRAVLALGAQDIGDATKLLPLDTKTKIVGGSSDHTIVDVTESDVEYEVGDIMGFHMIYMPLLYAFSTRHINIKYSKEN